MLEFLGISKCVPYLIGWGQLVGRRGCWGREDGAWTLVIVAGKGGGGGVPCPRCGVCGT